ncbi:udp-glucose 4-epimerase [Cystoisospora suis]|uniref:UDP-glucose 4-epimerase n=1 Tax=Cystoisospora suis TaxID=483139 RepID=A0A2C6KHF8_9APIC|nr:udp-glucose 4-epimerase [Cystoisospora suis]
MRRILLGESVCLEGGTFCLDSRTSGLFCGVAVRPKRSPECITAADHPPKGDSPSFPWRLAYVRLELVGFNSKPRKSYLRRAPEKGRLHAGAASVLSPRCRATRAQHHGNKRNPVERDSPQHSLLLDRGFTVGILDNLCNSSLEVLRRIRIVTNKEEEDPTFQFFNIDLRDEAALKKLFEENRFDAVIHYAGLKSVSESLQLALDYYSTNVGGTLNLLRAMDATGCRRLVFSSSAAVYKLKAERIVETDPLGAATPYGRTKMMIEQILQDLHASDRRWRISILRYFNPVGAHASGLLGESPDLPSNLVPFLQHVAVGRQPHLNVFGTDWDTPDGTGDTRKDSVFSKGRGGSC